MMETPVQRLASEVLRLSAKLYTGVDADLAQSAFEELAEAAEQLLQSEPENATDALALAWWARQLFRGMMRCQVITPEHVEMFERNQHNLVQSLERLSGKSVEIFSETPESGGGIH